MKFKIYDGNGEFWKENEQINMTADELRKRFGIPSDDDEQTLYEVDPDTGLKIPVDTANAHRLGTPQYDIFDQQLADQQFEDFIRAGRTIPDDDDQPIEE